MFEFEGDFDYEEYAAGTGLIDPMAEHMDHVFGEAPEMQNCLTEAKLKVAELNREANFRLPNPDTGEVRVLVRQPYFCQSTDAFAGMVDSDAKYFPNHDEAQAWVGNQEPDDSEFVTEPAPEVKVAEHYDVGTDDDFPF